MLTIGKMIKSSDYAYYWQTANGLALLGICQFSQASQGLFLKSHFSTISPKSKCREVLFIFYLGGQGRVKFGAGKGNKERLLANL